MQDIYYPETDQISLTLKETFYGVTVVPKKVSPLYVFENKRCYKRIHIIYKNKVHLATHFHVELNFGIQQSQVNQKIATM